MQPLARAQPLRDQIEAEIRRAILVGRFRPGERLTEESLALSLGVSRTPVREALNSLGVHGVLEVRRPGGYHVPAFDERDLNDFIDVRLLLEPHAARCAATSRDPALLDALRTALTRQDALLAAEQPAEFFLCTQQFWQALWAFADNRGYGRCLSQLVEHYHFQYVSVLALGAPAVRRQGVALLHDLVALIEAGDADAAAACVTRHLEFKRAALLAALPRVLRVTGDTD